MSCTILQRFTESKTMTNQKKRVKGITLAGGFNFVHESICTSDKGTTSFLS